MYGHLLDRLCWKSTTDVLSEPCFMLPPKYFKIRYYGLFSNRNKKKKIKICREILGEPKDKDEPGKPISWEDLLLKLTGEDPRICPGCKKGLMVRKGDLQPIRNPLVRKGYLSTVINSPSKEIV